MRRFSPPVWFSLALCLASINFLSNTAVETSNVYMALYARSIGSSNLEVGLIAAAMGITFLVAALVFGRLSDINGRVKFIRAGLALTSLSFYFQTLAHNPWTLMGARAFVGFCGGINVAVIMAYTYEHQKQIGNFISYGALGWLVGAMLAALVKVYHWLFIASAVISFIACLISFLLKEHKDTATRIQVAAFPVHLLKSNYKIFLGFFLRQLGGMGIWTVWPLYLSSIGATKFWISVMDATNMLGQFIASRFIERFNPARMFQLGLGISVVVFALYGAANHYLQIVPIQLLLAMGYSTLFIGALHYLLKHHRERGTVAGLLNSTMSFAGSIGPFLGGAISQEWGYGAVMYAASGITLVALLTSRGLNGDKKTEDPFATAET
jgi:MFS family permease